MTKQEPDIKRKDIATILNTTYGTIYKWEQELGIHGQPYTSENITLLEIRKQQSKQKNKVRSKIKINIIDFFLHNINNTAVEISEKMSLKVSYVNQVLDEWMNNDKFILVDSKINK